MSVASVLDALKYAEFVVTDGSRRKKRGSKERNRRMRLGLRDGFCCYCTTLALEVETVQYRRAILVDFERPPLGREVLERGEDAEDSLYGLLG